jgi:dGTPase
MGFMKRVPYAPGIWSAARRPRPVPVGRQPATMEPPAFQVEFPVSDPLGHRSVFQQDYDRLLFSTPVRRLADKTQVWPMDDNDGVRTRLTHSHEVANLARSIGTRAFEGAKEYFRDHDGEVSLGGTIQPMLQAIGLGHDLGNPPFGHQGEAAIGRWFERRKNWIFTHTEEQGAALSQPVSEDLHPEFLEFDGNPQSLRLLTKLQTHIDGLGLDLSAATLAAGLKYPVHVASRNKASALAKKGGYFASERDVVDWVRTETGLGETQRHPLTWIMEACDDIAYSVLDVDDLLKKGMMSPDDVLVILRRRVPSHPVVEKLNIRFDNVEGREMVPAIQRDIKIQYLRAFLIEALITHAGTEFVKSAAPIFTYDFDNALMDSSLLCETLKGVAKQNAFSHPTVFRTEAAGAAAIDVLLTALWDAISNREVSVNLRSRRRSARASYVFSLISPNYIEQAVAAENLPEPASGLRYRELRLLTDMVSGMTDTFAMKVWRDISGIPHADRA